MNPAAPAGETHQTPGGLRSALWMGRASQVAAWLAVLFALLLVVIPRYPPCSDAGAHLLSVVVKLHPERFVGQYEPQTAWTGQSYVTLTWLFAHLLPVLDASRVVLALGLMAHVAGLRAVATRIGANVSIAMALGAIGFVGWIYAMGFFSFSLATAFGACAWAAWVRRDDHPAWRGVFAVLLVGAAWSHSIATVLWIAHLVLIELLRGWPIARPRWQDLVALVPGTAWTGVTSLLALRQYAALGIAEAMPAAWLSPAEAAWMAAAGGLGSFSRWAVLPTLGALALAIRGSMQKRSDAESGHRRAAARAAVVWTLGFFVLPFHGLGWFYASARTLYFASCAAPAVSGDRQRSATLGVLVPLACAAALLASLPAAVFESRRIARIADELPRHNLGTMFVVVYHGETVDPVTQFTTPMLSTAFFGAMPAGGAIPGAFAFPSLKHSIRFAAPFDSLFPRTSRFDLRVSGECREDPACAGAAADAMRADETAAHAVHWDTLLALEAPPPFVERLLARGFEPLHGAMVAFRPRPATLDVLLPAASLAPGEPIVFRAGYPDTIGWFRGGTIRPASIEPSGVRLRFAPMPAGPVRIEVFVDRDGDRELGANDRLLVREVHVVVPGSEVTLSPHVMAPSDSQPDLVEEDGAE